jgi:universal stress protein A
MTAGIKRILVATDFSLDSDAAVAYGLALAKTVHASIYLLHVVENPLAAGVWSSEIYTAEIAALQINLMRDAKKNLKRAIASIDHPGVKIVGDVRAGRPATTIVEAAREQRVDLIVIASHGRTGITRLMMGSVAEHVVRNAPCAVLVVRPPEPPQDATVAKKTAKRATV